MKQVKQQLQGVVAWGVWGHNQRVNFPLSEQVLAIPYTAGVGMDVPINLIVVIMMQCIQSWSSISVSFASMNSTMGRKFSKINKYIKIVSTLNMHRILFCNYF